MGSQQFCECACPYDTLLEARIEATARGLVREAGGLGERGVCVFDVDETLVRSCCYRCKMQLRRMRALRPVVEALHACRGLGHEVVVVTSRYGTPGGVEFTWRQLEDLCGVSREWATLLMRGEGDGRPSSDVKADLRRKFVRGRVVVSVGDQPGDLVPGSLKFLLPNPAYRAH